MRWIWLLICAVTFTAGCKKEVKNVAPPSLDVDEQAKMEMQLKKEADARIALPPDPDERGTKVEPVQEPVN